MSDLLRLMRFLRPYRAWVSGGIALSIATLLSGVALLALSGWFITAMALAGLAAAPMNYFTPAAAIRGLAILRTGGRYAERLVTHEATLRLLSALRVWFYERLEPLAPAGLQGHRRGDLLSRLRADVDSLDNFYLRVLAPAVTALLASALMIAFAALYSGAIAAVLALGLGLAGVALPVLALRLGQRPGAASVATRGALHAAVTDGTRGAAELRVYAATGRQAARIDALSDALIADQRRLAGIAALSAGLSALAAPLAMLAALLLAAPMVRGAALAPADLAMIALFVLAAFDAISGLPVAFQALGETRAAARRIFEIADAAPAVTDPAAPAAAPAGFGIRARDLSLRYPGSRTPAVQGLSFDLPEGQVLALSGPTGAGKTSVFNALLRFYDYGGSLTVGGVEVSAMTGDALRDLCAVVDQHSHLFNATIRDNLRLARPDAGDEALRAALGDAAVLDEVMAFPEGLDTFVGEAGSRLSGGQARRIAIARALLKDAPILLLDEPTENLDAASERRVIAALGRLVQGRTVLLISHRAGTLGLADRVLTITAPGPAA